MSHFTYLEAEWPQIHESARRSEALANGASVRLFFYVRCTLELAVACSTAVSSLDKAHLMGP